MQQNGFTKQERERIKKLYETVLERIYTAHIKPFPDFPEPVFLISDAYPGVWLEHAYDAVSFAQFDPAMAPVAVNQMRLFLTHQKQDGQLPCYVIDTSKSDAYRDTVRYAQIQECVSFTMLCLKTYELTADQAFLSYAYERCQKWDRWLCDHRMTLNTGLIELYCGFDTGHDFSTRFEGISFGYPEDAVKAGGLPEPLPLLAPDMNAVFYASRAALSRMAALLDKPAEAQAWQGRAEQVKQKLFQLCYCPQDAFFYDVDRQGRFRKHLSIHITSLFEEHVLDGEEAGTIYHRHLRSPDEFWTPFPFPSMAVADPGFARTRAGNCWSFYSQGLTALRCLLWMDDYGFGEDLERLMSQWVRALSAPGPSPFSQELDPFTGERSNSSEWYSSAMLFFIHAVRRLGLD